MGLKVEEARALVEKRHRGKVGKALGKPRGRPPAQPVRRPGKVGNDGERPHTGATVAVVDAIEYLVEQRIAYRKTKALTARATGAAEAIAARRAALVQRIDARRPALLRQATREIFADIRARNAALSPEDRKKYYVKVELANVRKYLRQRAKARERWVIEEKVPDPNNPWAPPTRVKTALIQIADYPPPAEE
jgi:hypothetical protein